MKTRGPRRTLVLALVLAVAGIAGVAPSAPAAPPTITEFPVPTATSGPAGITAGPDGNVWLVEFYVGIAEFKRRQKSLIGRVLVPLQLKLPQLIDPSTDQVPFDRPRINSVLRSVRGPRHPRFELAGLDESAHGLFGGPQFRGDLGDRVPVGRDLRDRSRDPSGPADSVPVLRRVARAS